MDALDVAYEALFAAQLKPEPPTQVEKERFREWLRSDEPDAIAAREGIERGRKDFEEGRWRTVEPPSPAEKAQLVAFMALRHAGLLPI